MALVCLDSNIIVWGIKKTPTAGQENMVPRAEAFIKKLDQEKTKMLIPAPVLTEILMPVPAEQIEKFLTLIQSKFRIGDADAFASIKAAEIWSNRSSSEQLATYRANHQIPKDKMKFDFLIAAIAITKKCEAIYSHDPHIATFVGDLIPVLQLPPLVVQEQLKFPELQ